MDGKQSSEVDLGFAKRDAGAVDKGGSRGEAKGSAPKQDDTGQPGKRRSPRERVGCGDVGSKTHHFDKTTGGREVKGQRRKKLRTTAT